MTTQRIAATYARVSMAEQARGDHLSLKTQTEGCVAKAEHELGCTVPTDASFRVEESHSGTDLKWRGSKLSGLLKLAHAHAFQVLVVYRPDRFGRAGSKVWLHLYDRFEEAGVEVRFVLNDIPPGPVKRTMLTILADMAEADNANRVDATMRQKRARVAAGFPLVGPRPPYGYSYVLAAEADYNGRRRKLGLQTDPQTAPIVQLIFVRLAAGWKLRKLAAQLDADHVPPPRIARGMKGSRTNRWNPTSLARIVTDPTYWGERVAFRYSYKPRDEDDRDARDLSTYRQATDRLRNDPTSPELKRLPASTCPGIVPKELAMQVRARLTDNQKLAKRNGHLYTDADVLLYGGIVRCVACGRIMSPKRMSLSAAHGDPDRRKWLYVCHYSTTHSKPCPAGGTNIVAGMVDEFVWQEAVRLVRDPDYFEHLVRESEDVFSPKARLARAEHDLARAEQQLTGLATQLAALEGDTAPLIREQLQPQLATWAQNRADALAEYEQARVAADDEERRRATITSFREMAQAEASGQSLDNLTPERRRNIILALHPRVFIAPTSWTEWTVRIDLIFDLSGDSAVAQLLERADTARHGAEVAADTYGISAVRLPGQAKAASLADFVWDAKGHLRLPENWRELFGAAGEPVPPAPVVALRSW